MKDNFKIINKKNLHNGFYKLKELTIKHKKHNGSWSNPIKREIFGGAHVSTVLPYDSKNKKILLIKQFRPGVIKQGINPIVTEIVAGIIDGDLATKLSLDNEAQIKHHGNSGAERDSKRQVT